MAPARPAEVAAYAVDERCGFAFSAGLSLDGVRAVRKINDLPTRPAPRPGCRSTSPWAPRIRATKRMALVHELIEDFRYLGPHDHSSKGYPGARHEILNETNRDEVQQGLLTWLNAHT